VGFPVTPLEPMAGGLPIIATAVPGIAEIIADETPLPGIIVPVADVSALVSALERLLNDIEPSQDLGFHAKETRSRFLAGICGYAIAVFPVGAGEFMSCSAAQLKEHIYVISTQCLLAAHR
jgi:glycosyltransferase involved in cell wall biosynthesis